MTTATLDRTEARKAYVMGMQNAPMGAELSDRQRPAIEKPPRADLGPNQLQWLREHVPSFEICERLAVESEAHRKRLRDAVNP
jgi:hypothetical protein